MICSARRASSAPRIGVHVRAHFVPGSARHRFQQTIQHGPHRLLDDVLHDVVRRVVGAGRLALALVRQQVDAPVRYFQVVLQQPFVDAAQVADFEVAVVDEDAQPRFGILDARQAVDGAAQVQIADALPAEKG